MIATLRYIALISFLIFFYQVSAQGLFAPDTLVIPAGYNPEFKRLRNHELIDAEQKGILQSDGNADDAFSPSKEEEVNFMITGAVTKGVDILQYKLETDNQFDHRIKVIYLSGLENLLKYFRQNWKIRSDKRINPLHFPMLLNAYQQCIEKNWKNETIESIVLGLPYDVGTNLLAADIFNKNAGYKTAKDGLALKYCLLHPEKTFSTLQQNPDVPFADSLIRLIAKKYPRQLYDYSQANNRLGVIIRSIRGDNFIEAVVKMSRSKDGQQYFCFLDNIVSGKLKYEEIDAAKDDSLKYYQLLVKTQIEYVYRALNKDTAFEFSTLTQRLEKKAKENFVNIINGLHNENAEVRFRCIQPLTAEELYYLAVASDESMYTSSFVKGVYPLMMKKINYKGDSLLTVVGFDKYRKFIKMSAGFNMLSDFLNSFPQPKNQGEETYAAKLMRAFVGRLEIGDELEDGVDVADSYASIEETIKPLADEMMRNIELNYQRNNLSGNKRGMAIYKILKYLFLSADSVNKIDLTKELGIPPVYEVPFSSLAIDTNQVIVQVFIYGDKDGIGVFPTILNLFANTNWKIDRSNPQWVVISSLKGKPVSIYLNKPLPEEKNEDALAQEALCKFLAKNKLYPSVTINRGHSYNAPYTIEQMFPTSKIVFMGSCGGYRSIHDILEKAPDAHIIGTKQIADAPVNNPFLQLLCEKLREGSNIEWIPFWKELGKKATDPIFADYVPPYKNLGALFIKAYKIAMGETTEEDSKGF